MSKATKTAKPVEEEEWEDVDENEVGDEEEEEDTTIANSDVVMRYKKAAQWANEVLTATIAKIVPDASVAAVCKAADDLILEKVATLFRGVDKGVAFPTCVSVNACVCHFNGSEEDVIIKLGDVVRIDLGVHVDGYAALVAHTIQVTANGELAADSKEAAVIAAGYATIDAALRQVRPGHTTTDVATVIEKAAANFGLNSVEGVLSHQLKRYIVDGWKTIPSKATTEHKVHEYEIETNTVWALDVVLTTSKGVKLRERDAKPCLYKANIDGQYEPKLQASFETRAEITTKFQYFPFAVSRLEAPKARLGLSELSKHGVISQIPVLYEKDGETVAHFKVTLLVTDKKIERVTGIPLQKGAPAVPAYADAELAAKAKLPLSLAPKKEKK